MLKASYIFYNIKTDYTHVFNYLIKNRNEKFSTRLFDSVASVGFGLISICCFYGIWSAEEVYFSQADDFSRGENAWLCVVLEIYKLILKCAY